MVHKPNTCFHCGQTLAPVAESACCKKQSSKEDLVVTPFQLDWEGETRTCCSESCLHAAHNIIERGLGDFYRLPRTFISNKRESTSSHSVEQLNKEQIDYFSRSLGEHLQETFLFIPDLHCSSCAWVIERALTQVSGVVQVGINSLTRRVHVVFNHSETDLNTLLVSLSDIGYPAQLLEFIEVEKQRRTERKTLLKQILVAGFGTMQAMSFALVIYVSGEGQLDQVTLSFFKWLGFLVATPVVFYSARPFFSGTRKALSNKNLNMDVPIALSVVLTYAASFYQAVSEGGEVYFDSVSMLVFLILLGRYLELLSRHKAQDGLDGLNRAISAFVEKKHSNGMFEKTRVSGLEPGDCIRVNAGELIPVDGALLTGYAAIDQSLVNGEFELVEKQQGETLLSGSLVSGQSIELEVTHSQEQSFITALQSLSLKAQTQKSSLVNEGDTAASRFVFAVLCFTAISAALWLMFDSSRAFDAALAVLVVSCPCAFALATPAVVTRSLSVFAQRGILLVNSDALKRILDIDTLVFDKTGTLTDAQVSLKTVQQGFNSEKAFLIANSLSQQSQHPLSVALKKHASGELLKVENIHLLSGLGISGVIDGEEYRLGRAEFVLDRAQASTLQADKELGSEALMLANTKGVVATFSVEEHLRPQARLMLRQLGKLGLHCEILSGDSEERVSKIAAQLDISSWKSRQLPWQKLQHLEELKASGKKVLMLGDGNNDAPILAAAEVSVSFASGANLAKSQADLLLCSDNLFKLVEVFYLAQQAERILRQNKQWAVIYNLVAVPFAALGFVAPWLAAIGMSTSSLMVVGNAFRIGRQAKRSESRAGEVQWA